ncbi:helix-turn-helix domain-containing protein [Parvularcula marina]|uniref:XRE family transcriptional regulator n=1 Tax=Parvularcula marina TaxID=2292771 RepID=A0A371R7H9_9PROT|nr:helix-turn-helix transcriptional regulator [Parvularcula marina]RFB01411.1 XRE family transcriptional regulator [Parvularcula marina]
MNDITKHVASRIKALRKAAGLSQAELAKLTRKSLETISNFERAKTTPSIRSIGQLAEALNVPPEAFFADMTVKSQGFDATLQKRAMALSPRDREFLFGVIDLLQRRKSSS